jgi:hypothetical protein
MINSTIPTLALPNDRFSIPFDGIPTFVRSSYLKKNQQSGRGSLISYRPKNHQEFHTSGRLALCILFGTINAKN